jgi:DNA-binding beta-propeller fold protein YncE
LIYTQIDPNAVFKVQWAVYDDIEGTYMPKFTPESNVDLLKNNLFSQPAAITIDDYSNIYVIDAQKDSLYKFSGNGMLKSESFGGHGSSLTQFSGPMGVAFFYKTLYICDSGNNRILRFILSTDIH